MILRDERIICISAIMDNLILAGTKKGHIIVFDSESHKQLNKMVKVFLIDLNGFRILKKSKPKVHLKLKKM